MSLPTKVRIGTRWKLQCPECQGTDIQVRGTPSFLSVKKGVVVDIDIDPDSKDEAQCSTCDFEGTVNNFDAD